MTNETTDDTTTISAGAALFRVFQTDCTDALSLIPADQNLKDLKEVIRGTGSVQPALFIPDSVFNSLVLKQLQLLDIPSIEAISKAHACLNGALEKIAATTLQRYPKMTGEVMKIAGTLLADKAKEAKEFVKQYLANEQAYVNTNHPEFVERYQVVVVETRAR